MFVLNGAKWDFNRHIYGIQGIRNDDGWLINKNYMTWYNLKSTSCNTVM